MIPGVEPRTRVACRDCAYARTVPASAPESPADVVVAHGRATGHKLRVEYPEL